MAKLMKSLLSVVSLSFVVLTFASARSQRIRYYLNATLYILSLGVCSTLGVFYAVILGLTGNRYNTNLWVARSFARIAGTLIGYNVKIEGAEYLKQRPAIIVGNHQSFLDILYLGAMMPAHSVIMAKKELRMVPLLGQFMFIDRKSRSSAIKTMRQAGDRMRRDKLTLFAFPEGTRSHSALPELLPFKKGVFHLALQNNLPIIPVVCENYHRLYDSKTRFEGGDLHLAVLPPISTEGMTETDTDKLIALVHDAMLRRLLQFDVQSDAQDVQSTLHPAKQPRTQVRGLAGLAARIIGDGSKQQHDRTVRRVQQEAEALRPDHAGASNPSDYGLVSASERRCVCDSDPDAGLYAPLPDQGKGPMFKCLGTDQIIPYKQINDDYCDCADGSDEPGTSACDNGRFYCENKGHIPAYIRSSQVNDAVCDEACCDGSDETDGKVHCPNVCAEVNKAYRKERAKQAKVYAAGAKIRDQYVQTARNDREFHETALARLRAELPGAEETEAQLKRALEAAENVGTWFEQQKRQSALFAQLELRQSTLRSQRDALGSLVGELRAVGNMLERLSPESSKEDLESVAESFRIWRGQVFDGDDERDATLEEKLAALTNVGELSDEDLETLINEDPLLLLDGAPDFSQGAPQVPDALRSIPSYLPDAFVPLYERGVAWLVDTLIHLDVISPQQRENAGRPYQHAKGLAAAREAHEKGAEALNKIKNDIRYHEQRMRERANKIGRDGEFQEIDGTCLKKDMGEYTYEFCFGGTTKQISNNDGYTFSLGRFEKFDVNGQFSTDDPRHYLTMLYAHGQTCWNGPPRSTHVKLECSDTNELLHVFEAEKCTYSMRVATPAVCFPKEEAVPEVKVEHTEL